MADAAALLADARRVLIFTGAGISTEAGIPDFRSAGGIWSRLDPQTFSIENFRKDPAAYWRLRADLVREMDLDARPPTPGHAAIARFAATRRLLGVATQNIDGLHERAGLPEPLLARLHGSAAEVLCTECRARFPIAHVRADLDAGKLPPRCSACGGVVKPGTVLFGEEMPAEPLHRAFDWAARCDLCLVVGSSLSVYPAASIPERALERGARIVIVNRDPTPLDDEAHAVVRSDAGTALPRLLLAV